MKGLSGKYNMAVKIGIVFFLMVAIGPIASNSPDRAFCEKILGENKRFIDFLNPGVSNFARRDHLDEFRAASEAHYKAHREYLSGHYRDTHNHIRDSQRILKDLYFEVLNEYYQKDTRELLERNSAMIVETKDVRAQHFMRLGYRDLKVSEIYEGKGFNHNRHLYSTKIWFYIDAIKYARQAKRYAFLAIIESQTPFSDKDDFKQQTIDDYFNKPEVEKQRDFEKVEARLINLINRKLVVNNYNFFFHHYDNYGYINRGKTNQYEEYVMEKAKENFGLTRRPQ